MNKEVVETTEEYNLRKQDGYNDCMELWGYGDSDYEDVKKNTIGKGKAYRDGWLEALAVIH